MFFIIVHSSAPHSERFLNYRRAKIGSVLRDEKDTEEDK